MTGLPAIAAVAAFLAGAAVSLATSWLLVSRLERVGARLGLSEALLGLVAALAADAPEVTAAITAMAGHQQRLGAGVVIGSNVFNLAALLGLGTVAAGRISLHRKVVALGGAVAIWVACACLGVVLGVVPAAAGLVLAFGAVAMYAVVLGAGERGLRRLPLPRRWITWLRSAVAEEELELEEAIVPRRARRKDVVTAAASLLVVIAASVMMELAASALGTRFAVPEIVVGGLVLAAVTSLPNAVAAIYLAARGRGAATLSTALNSNALNVTIGLLLPAVVIGLGRPSAEATLITVWYLGLTAAVLAFAYRDRGISRPTGILIIVAYLVFAGSTLAFAYAPRLQPQIAIGAGAAVAVVCSARLAFGRRRESDDPQTAAASRPPSARQDVNQRRSGSPEASANGRGPEDERAQAPGRHQPRLRGGSLVPGWPVGQLWALGLALSLAVAAADAALGARVVLIGLLIIGPCCVLLTGRWVPTGLTGLCVIGLALALGIPDGIWGTSIQLAFLAAVTVVSVATTCAAAIISSRKP